MFSVLKKSPYPYPPPKRKAYLAIAIPTSVTLVEETLYLKTLKIGAIARAAAIHRVNEIVVYNDKPEAASEQKLIVDILEYLRTPPYLRRKLIPLKETLRYAGILPPLQTPNHPQTAILREGEVREGLVRKIRRKYMYVDVGAKNLVKVSYNGKTNVGNKVYVKILKSNHELLGEIVSEKQVNHYLCFKISSCRDLRRLLNRKWDFKIATSRYGKRVTEVIDLIKENILGNKKVLIAFGGPKEGLYEIASKHKLSIEEAFDVIVNTIPYQGVEVVRTEEAIHATLELISLLETCSASLLPTK